MNDTLERVWKEADASVRTLDYQINVIISFIIVLFKLIAKPLYINFTIYALMSNSI
jgi:hypothetical protein